MSDSRERISLKVQQIQRALEDFSSSDLQKVVLEPISRQHRRGVSINFDSTRSPAEKANNISLLLANIGSLKDNLKVWCEEHGKPFRGEEILKISKSAAIIHDLWNIDKHGKLNRKPRSGFTPRLEKPSTALILTGGPEANGFAAFGISPITGKISSQVSGSGKASIELSAKVFNGDVFLGEIKEIAEQALKVWMMEFEGLGLLS